MRVFKISPKVGCVTGKGNKVLEDKEQDYPESTWPNGHADELVRRGFIYEVIDGPEGESGEKKISMPEKDTKVQQVKPGKGQRK